MVSDVLQTIGDRLQTAATVKAVFGEPVTAGERTVIPVARVRFGFGAGGGKRPSEESGAGGGGGAQATPAGIVEITPTGTSWIPFDDNKRLIGALLLGVSVGMILARRK